MMTITVLYTCGICDIVDAEVHVPARAAENQDLMEWMEMLSFHIAQDHARRSPFCRPRKLKQVKIPVENAGWVGGPPIQ